MWSVFLKIGQILSKFNLNLKKYRKNAIFRIFLDIKRYNLDTIRPVLMKFGCNNLGACRFLPHWFELNSCSLSYLASCKVKKYILFPPTKTNWSKNFFFAIFIIMGPNAYKKW